MDAPVGAIAFGVDEGAAVVASLQPNQPGVSHVAVLLLRGVGWEDDVVDIGAGEARGVVTVLVRVLLTVVESLQPNQPGVLHVEVESVLVMVVVVYSVEEPEELVVDSSRHPHHPGVLHVSLLVRVREVVAVEVALLVVFSVPLLSKNFHL